MRNRWPLLLVPAALILIGVPSSQVVRQTQPVETEMVELIPIVGPATPAPPPSPNDGKLMLRSGPVEIAALRPQAAEARTREALGAQGLGPGDMSYYVVHVPAEASLEAARQRVQEAGGEIMGHVPRNGYVVRGRGNAIVALRGTPTCDFAVALRPGDRIAPRLAQRLGRWRNREGDPVILAVSVLTFPGEAQDGVRRALRDLGLQVLDHGPNHGLGALYRLRCEGPAVAAIAAIPGVQWIEEWRAPQLHMDRATGSGGSGCDLLNIADLGSTYGLDGSGMVVGHADTGVDIGEDSTALHRDFLTEDGAATRLVHARCWAPRTDGHFWMRWWTTDDDSHTSEPMYQFTRWESDTDSGVVRSVEVNLYRDESAEVAGDVVVRLYRDGVFPSDPGAMPGAPTATSTTAVRAEELPTTSGTASTFYFDPKPEVGSGETWWAGVDLSGVTNYQGVRVPHFSYSRCTTYEGDPGSAWVTCSWALACRVCDELPWSDVDGHGTHTLGAIVGNGRTCLVGGSPAYRAPAYQAGCVHQCIQTSHGALTEVPCSLEDLFQEAYDYGARIHADSWGTGVGGSYTVESLQVDDYVWQHPDFLPVFSAGNHGRDGGWYEPATPLTVEQPLDNAYQRHLFKLDPEPTGALRAVVLSLRRSADATGQLAVSAWFSCGTPRCAFAELGTIDVEDLPYITGGPTDRRPFEFRTTYQSTPVVDDCWICLEWTGASGTVYVGCNESGTANYTYLAPGSPPSWVYADSRQAVRQVTADGVVDTGSIASPATAKNCLAVGASETSRYPNGTGYDLPYDSEEYAGPIGGESSLDDPEGIAAFSSRGPTEDGRVKPDLIAPGSLIASCRSQRIPTLMSDDVEAGPGSFTTAGCWSRSTDGSLSGSYCYQGLATGTASETYLTYAADIDLSAQDEVVGDKTLWFWARYDLVGSLDRVHLEFSSDGGGTWTDEGPGYDPLWHMYGATTNGAWVRQSVVIDRYKDGSPGFRFRFWFKDNGDANHGVCYLDDFVIWQPNGSAARLNVLEAAGWDDYASGASNRYEFRSGTSVAAALTAGVATLVREYYVEQRGINPSAALIKATMMNEAVDLSPGQYGTGSTQEVQPRPDVAQGWGRVNAKGCLLRTAPRVGGYVLADDTTGWRFTGEGQTRVIDLAVPDSGPNLDEPIKVTLAWTDRPGSLYASPCLVDDLNLTVQHLATDTNWSKGGADATWYGNGEPTGDAVNTVEQVDIPAPVTWGWYRITVSCAALPLGGPQPWALVASGGFTEDPGPLPVVIDGLTIERTGRRESVLTWGLAADLGIIGCRVHRGEGPSGPMREISSGLIRSDDGRYRFVDASARPGRDWWYCVEAINAGGEVEAAETVRTPP